MGTRGFGCPGRERTRARRRRVEERSRLPRGAEIRLSKIEEGGSISPHMFPTTLRGYTISAMVAVETTVYRGGK